MQWDLRREGELVRSWILTYMLKRCAPKIENTSDDPRAFQGAGHIEEDAFDPEDFLCTI